MVDWSVSGLLRPTLAIRRENLLAIANKTFSRRLCPTSPSSSRVAQAPHVHIISQTLTRLDLSSQSVFRVFYVVQICHTCVYEILRAVSAALMPRGASVRAHCGRNYDVHMIINSYFIAAMRLHYCTALCCCTMTMLNCWLFRWSQNRWKPQTHCKNIPTNKPYDGVDSHAIILSAICASLEIQCSQQNTIISDIIVLPTDDWNLFIFVLWAWIVWTIINSTPICSRASWVFVCVYLCASR